MEHLENSLSRDGSTVVSATEFYQPMSECPSNKKVLLLSAGGVASVGTWDGKNAFYVGWYPLPRRPYVDQKRN